LIDYCAVGKDLLTTPQLPTINTSVMFGSEMTREAQITRPSLPAFPIQHTANRRPEVIN